MSRLHRGKKYLSHSLIDSIAAEVLTGLARQVFMHLRTEVNGLHAIVHIPHGHPSPTATAEGQALLEGMALSYSPTSLVRAVGAIIIELLDIGHKLFPTEIPRMMITEYDGPINAWHAVTARFNAWRFAW